VSKYSIPLPALVLGQFVQQCANCRADNVSISPEVRRKQKQVMMTHRRGGAHSVASAGHTCAVVSGVLENSIRRLVPDSVSSIPVFGFNCQDLTSWPYSPLESIRRAFHARAYHSSYIVRYGRGASDSNREVRFWRPTV